LRPHSSAKFLKNIFLILLPVFYFNTCAGLPSVNTAEITEVPVAVETAPGETVPEEIAQTAALQTALPEPVIPAPVIPPPVIPDPPKPDYVTIIAAGDNLLHDVMIRYGERGDYNAFYSEILAIVGPADISIINQETPLGGAAFGFTGYPNFNSPQAVGRAVAAAGFNVVNQANNHTMDRGERAVFATMDFWDTIPDVTVIGVYRSQEHRNKPVLITKNNITMGFLSYTFGTNGIPVPRDKPFLVPLINRQIMSREINALRPLCDFLIVSMHWGDEYVFNYNREQANLAAFLAEHKVDLVIGHHPHVLQPVKFIQRPDGGTMLCFYSLGNFISAQRQPPTLLGALGYVKIKRPPPQDGETGAVIVFEDVGAIPVVTHYEAGFNNFKVIPLYAYTQDLLNRHLRNPTRREIPLNYFSTLAARVLGDKKLSRNPFDPGI